MRMVNHFVSVIRLKIVSEILSFDCLLLFLIILGYEVIQHSQICRIDQGFSAQTSHICRNLGRIHPYIPKVQSHERTHAIFDLMQALVQRINSIMIGCIRLASHTEPSKLLITGRKHLGCIAKCISRKPNGYIRAHHPVVHLIVCFVEDRLNNQKRNCDLRGCCRP